MATKTESCTEEEESKIMDYFQQNFHLKLYQPYGIIRDDINLRNLLKIVYKLLKKEKTLEQVLTGLESTKENYGVGHWMRQMGLPVGEHQVDSNFVQLLPKIFTKIKDYRSQDGHHALTFLSQLTCLFNENIQAKLCYHIFYSQPIKFNDQGQSDPESTDKISKMAGIISILEEYSLVSKFNLDEQSDSGEVSDTELESATEPEHNFGVKVHPIVYNFVRNEGQSMKHDKNNLWSTEILKLAHLFCYSQILIRSVKYQQHLQSLHEGLFILGWPQKSFVYSLNFATAQIVWFNNQEKAWEILNCVYKHLLLNKQDEKDEEYFIVCRMALIYLKNLKLQLEQPFDPGQKEWEEPEKEMMNNDDLFEKKDDLYEINRLNFFDWVLGSALEFPHNELIQHFTAQCLLTPVVVYQYQFDDGRYGQIISCIRQYCRHQAGQNFKTGQIFQLKETPLTFIKIAVEVIPSVRVVQMAVAMTRVNTLNSSGVIERLKFLQESMYMTKPSPICVWEQEELNDTKLIEMCEICLVFVEHGETCFVEMLTELETNFNHDYSLDLHVLDFLEILKAAAYFEKCVVILLESTELLTSLRKCFNKIVDSIETNLVGGENIKAVCHILVFWYAVLCNCKGYHVRNKSYISIMEQMEQFYEKLTQEESQISKAFYAERHWHSYFREQGETSEKILEKYLNQPRDDDYLEEMITIYQLAGKLKATMRKDWWLTSFNFITTTTRMFKGDEKRRAIRCQKYESLDSCPDDSLGDD